jgi:alanine racemase
MRRCWIEIDLAALERNLERIRFSLPSSIKYVAVVKADAYGHGMAQTVTRLMCRGVDIFAVANLQEAAQLNEIGAGWAVLILSPVLPDEDELLSAYKVIVTISSIEECERFSRVGKQAGKPVFVHLKIDTGMGRIGVWHENALALYKKN